MLIVSHCVLAHFVVCRSESFIKLKRHSYTVAIVPFSTVTYRNHSTGSLQRALLMVLFTV